MKHITKKHKSRKLKTPELTKCFITFLDCSSNTQGWLMLIQFFNLF